MTCRENQGIKKEGEQERTKKIVNNAGTVVVSSFKPANTIALFQNLVNYITAKEMFYCIKNIR